MTRLSLTNPFLFSVHVTVPLDLLLQSWIMYPQHVLHKKSSLGSKNDSCKALGVDSSWTKTHRRKG